MGITAAGDRFDRSRGRSIESIDSIDSIIFRSLAKFLKNRSRRDDRFRQKIVKIRAILAIFRPFEDFGDFRFDRFDIFFDSIDTEPNDRWGPPWRCCLLVKRKPLSIAVAQIHRLNCGVQGLSWAMNVRTLEIFYLQQSVTGPVWATTPIIKKWGF